MAWYLKHSKDIKGYGILPIVPHLSLTLSLFNFSEHPNKPINHVMAHCLTTPPDTLSPAVFVSMSNSVVYSSICQ